MSLGPTEKNVRNVAFGCVDIPSPLLLWTFLVENAHLSQQVVTVLF